MKLTVISVTAMLLFLGVTENCCAAEPSSTTQKSLRLFNTEVFGHSTDDAIVLLESKHRDSINPETVMVDVDQDRYFAATVTYPKEISFAEARRCLNSRFGKWEKASFADDPTMGLWRNEDDKFAIQMTESGDTLQLIYIKFSLVTPDVLMEALGKAARELSDDSEQQK